MKIFPRIAFALLLGCLVSLTYPGQAQTNNVQRNSIYPLERWKIDYIVEGAYQGNYVSLALDPDHADTPWISYYQYISDTEGALWVAHRVGSIGGNCGPANNWLCEQVDYATGFINGFETSIDIYPDTNPDPLVSTWKVGISYTAGVTPGHHNEKVKYAEYSCTSGGNCAWTTMNVDASTYNVFYPTLMFNSQGIPHIAYIRVEWSPFGNITMVTRAFWLGDTTGNCGDDNNWWCEYINGDDSASNTQASLFITTDDQDVITYHENYVLKVASFIGKNSTNSMHPDHWSIENIDNNVTFETSHAPVYPAGPMYIAYYQYDSRMLKFASSNWNGTGNCGPANDWMCIDIEPIGNMGEILSDISLDLDQNNQPVIAYGEQLDGTKEINLRIATPAVAGMVANCANGTWWCALLDHEPTIHEGKTLSLKFNSHNQAMLAYTELIYINGIGQVPNLKFAFTQGWSFLPFMNK